MKTAALLETYPDRYSHNGGNVQESFIHKVGAVLQVPLHACPCLYLTLMLLTILMLSIRIKWVYIRAELLSYKNRTDHDFSWYLIDVFKLGRWQNTENRKVSFIGLVSRRPGLKNSLVLFSGLSVATATSRGLLSYDATEAAFLV